jgi:ankyrin repeat protein
MHAILAEHEHIELIQFLIEHSQDINCVDTAHGWAALHFAARGQKRGSVRLLLAAGAAVDVENVDGNTPLFLSLTGTRPDLVMLEELLLHGAQPDHRNHNGVSPLSLARTRQWTDVEVILRR